MERLKSHKRLHRMQKNCRGYRAFGLFGPYARRECAAGGDLRAAACCRSKPLTTILVAGGTGGVGEAVVRALLEAEHHVIVPSRNAARLERLRLDATRRGSGRGTLLTLTGEIGTPAGAADLRDRIARDCETLDVVIPSLGGWWEGALPDVSLAVWDAVMHEMLRTHFIFAQTFIPVLRAQPAGGRYLAMGGGAAYHPIRNAALVSIAAAAQLMMTRALRLEIDDPKIDILELVVDGPVRTRDSQTLAEDFWIDADDVAAVTLELAERGFTAAPHTQTSGPIVRMKPARSPGGVP
jgi:NAD(P)-dependent dehydrogenase (short-subunit alcohol dehydrogenase family)